MKKLLLFILCLCALIGCEEQNKVDMFGVQFSDYPIAGKAYKRITPTLSGTLGNDYDLYIFTGDGRCNVDYYFDGKHKDGAGIYDYYYWMERDSIFIDCGKDGAKRQYKYMRGKYFGDYIVLRDDTMNLVQ